MPTTQILFFKHNHFSKSFIKIILHNRLFNFEDTFQNPQFFFLSKKKREQYSNIFSFSFVHVPECAHCTLSFSALYMLRNVLIVLLYYTYVT